MSLPEKNPPQMPRPVAIVAPDEVLSEPGANKTPPILFTAMEAELPAVLGVSRDVIRQIRQMQLKEGVDWVKRHKDILLTDAGVEKIRRVLALISGAEAGRNEGRDTADGPADRAATAPLGSPGGGLPAEAGTPNQEKAAVKVEVFKVLRSQFKNTFMVKAYDPEQPARIVWVRVKDNTKWVPGMEIEATHEHHDQYVLHGNNPRWRGKL